MIEAEKQDTPAAQANRGPTKTCHAAHPSANAPPDGLPNPARLLAMLAIMLGLGLSTMDGVIANVALPALRVAFHTTPAATIWIVNSYQLVMVCALLPCSSLGEIYGYRRIYLWGLTFFSVASLACAASRSLATLVIARALQGGGAAGVLSVNAALVRCVWPRALLGRGIGINAVIAAGGFALGPAVASIILTFGDWRWLFVMNIPLGLAAIAIAALSLPHVTSRRLGRFDHRSAMLWASTLIGGTWGTQSACDGASFRASTLLVGSALSGLILYRRETKSHAPLFPLDLLGIPLFRLSVFTSMCAFCALSLAMIALPFHLHAILHWPIARIGFLIAPWPAAAACMGVAGGRLADRYPPGPLGVIGMAGFSVGLGAIALLPGQCVASVVALMALCGISYGLFQTPNNRALLASASLERAGAAAGMLGLSRTIGLATGATLANLLFRLSSQGATIALYAAVTIAISAALVSLSRGRNSYGALQ